MYRNRRGYRPPELGDFGPEPLIINIDRAAKLNTNYRTALWTGQDIQVTLMSIPVGGEIGLEIHDDLDQFIRIESGRAVVMIGHHKDELTERQRIDGNYSVIIPAGTWHNIINTGNTPLKLYSIYSPPKHLFGTVHKTKEDAEAADK